MPANAAKMAGDLSEIRSRIAVENGARHGAKQKTQNPGTDDGVANGNPDGTDQRNHSESPAVFLSATLHGLFKSAYWAGAHGAAKGHFSNDAAKSKGNDKNQKRHNKRKAAVLANTVREQPNAAHANGRTDA